MAMDLPTLRKLLQLDPNDPLSRFALGKKLFEQQASATDLDEAVEHLSIANAKAPEHLATYHVLSQVLIQLGRNEDASRVLNEGLARVAHVGQGMGRDLGPAMQEMLESLSR
jgi:predicted Zn-dependent protease